MLRCRIAPKRDAGKCSPMLDIKKCRDILEEDGDRYTDEEIKIIYDFLKELADASIAAIAKTGNNEKSNLDGQGEF